MTIPYHKINSVFKRDPETNFKTFLDTFADPAFELLYDVEWTATEKVDGTNIRVSVQEDGLGSFIQVQGRTDKADLRADLVKNTIDVFHKLGDDHPYEYEGFTFYGEGYGAGIQKGGGNYRPDKSFVLFDVWSRIGGRWLERDEVNELGVTLGVPVVPVLGLPPRTLRNWFNAAQDGYYSESKLHPGAPNEGYVLRPIRELTSQYGRVISKLKFKDFA